MDPLLSTTKMNSQMVSSSVSTSGLRPSTSAVGRSSEGTGAEDSAGGEREGERRVGMIQEVRDRDNRVEKRSRRIEKKRRAIHFRTSESRRELREAAKVEEAGLGAEGVEKVCGEKKITMMINTMMIIMNTYQGYHRTRGMPWTQSVRSGPFQSRIPPATAPTYTLARTGFRF